jgi:hypothetical protein
MSAQPDTSLVAFKAIVNFTTNLSDEFGEDNKPIKLYNHLLSKTTLSHNTAIEKHIKCFKKFCVENRENISNFKYDKITGTIDYSNRVYIDIKEILIKSTKDTRDIIWQHLLIISAILDPTGKAKQILQEQKDSKTGDGEVNFLTDIIDKIENNVDPDTSNPMEAVSSIMKSGVFTDLVQGMGTGLQDGSLDLTKLMGTVQNMVSKLNQESNEDDNNGESVNMINNMMKNLTSNMQEKDECSGEMPDLSNMLGPMMNNMSQEGGPNIADMLGPMMNNMSQEGGPNIADMLGPMMNNMSQEGGDMMNTSQEGGPNIADMLGPMMSMIGNVNNSETTSSGGSVEDQINSQVEQAKKDGKI